MIRRIALLASSFLLFAHCGGSTAEERGITSIRVIPSFEKGWALTQLTLETSDRTSNVPDKPEAALTPREAFIVLLRDDVAGKKMDLGVFGLASGKRVAQGKTSFTPVLHQSLDVTVDLARIPCTTWCSPGTKVCDGDGVKECVGGEDDACPSWAPANACPASEPFCSAGTCSAKCVDECADGDAQCAGSSALQRCGQADSDTCLDWMPELRCEGGETCQSGTCSAAPCTNECASAGATQCANGGTSKCGQFDADTCLEWGPAAACPTGQSCSNGSCSSTCSDECSASSCAGDTWKQCGQYDLDPCQELSTGTACAPTDACHVGSCSAQGGCSTAAVVCDSPPAASCAGTTLRVYASKGTCAVSSGGCSYSHTDAACPAPANGTATCSAGFCGFACNAGYQRSGSVCVPTSAWTAQPSGTTQNLFGVGGAGGQVWAVGYGTANVVLTRSSTSWTQTTIASWPYAVFGFASNNVFIVGAQIFHSTGPPWQTQIAPNQGRYGIWGSSGYNVYAVGNAGSIVRTTGNGVWTAESSGTGNVLNDVWGSSASDVYVVGRQGTILHSTGNGVWTPQSSGTTEELNGIWGSGPNDIYVVGWGGRIMHSTGNGVWTTQKPTNNSFYDVWGSGSTDVYAVGGSGTIFHSAGNGVWSSESSGTTQTLHSIWGSGPTDITAVGDNGTILHR